MLKSSKNKNNLLISIFFIMICFFAYQYWASAASSDSQLVSTMGVQAVGDETLELLTQLRTLTLDQDMFEDVAFQNLEDFSMELRLQEVGRNNPFSPVGTDGEYTGVNVNAPVITACSDKDCFEENFAKCDLATVEVEVEGLSGLVGQDVTYRYEIIGPKGAYCEVESKFVKNPNQDWVGKEMICQYDNSQNFDTAVEDMDRCSGELYDLMIK
ncbi:MAG: hypothetical protein U9P50_03335 [Patescibacteria group bacterium]|nr:hypothetical protein [Patescibacteria group bacterium]